MQPKILFEKHALKNMLSWDHLSFKQSHKRLYNAIIDSIKEAFNKDALIWTEYIWEQKETHSPAAGRYLIYRESCDKMHFETFNGSGWSSTKNEPIKWSNPRKTNYYGKI